MKTFRIENLHKTYGTKTLLSGVDLLLQTGDRVGLIGVNGSGKSSFLKVIAGLDSYDEGNLQGPNDYRISYLDQNPELDEEKTILETVYDSPAGQIQRLLEYERARVALEKNPNDSALFDQFNRMSDIMNENNGWDVEINAKTILTQLGVFDLTKKVGECSGGERKRVGIAQVLISEPDLLILDEPTNHLDIASIQWLEKYLANYKGTLLIVTHDRYFLERSVNKIIELRQGKLYEYAGNYQDYIIQRAEEAAINERMQEKEDRKFVEELAWMRKGAKARTTKQQARIQRFESIKDNISARELDQEDIEFDFNQQRIGQRIMDLEDVSVEAYGKKIINHFTKAFVKGDRIGIIGENGVGKSTFLNTLVGMHPISSGVYELGQTVSFAFYKQLDQDLPADMRVLTYLTQIADEFKLEGGRSVSASQILEQFNFPRLMHGTEIRNLSGGEKRRLYLLSLLIQEPNVLILDEPTNDLDIDTLSVLEQYLDAFEGVVLIVSHDRYFLDNTVDQILKLKGDGDFELYYGNYSDYLAKENELNSQKIIHKKDTEKEQIEPKEIKKQRMSYQEKKEWASLEEDIAKTEEKIDQIQSEMSALTSDAYQLMNLHESLEETELLLLNYYERYEYLSELSL